MAIILVVDSEAAMRRMLFAAFAVNHTIIEAEDGPEGLVLFQLAGPDLIITDLILPAMSGIDFTRMVRARSARVKIIVQAAFISPAERAATLAAGADLCLQRPAPIEDLETAIEMLLDPGPFP